MNETKKAKLERKGCPIQGKTVQTASVMLTIYTWYAVKLRWLKRRILAEVAGSNPATATIHY